MLPWAMALTPKTGHFDMKDPSAFPGALVFFHSIATLKNDAIPSSAHPMPLIVTFSGTSIFSFPPAAGISRTAHRMC